jgi:outer membrane biosynthesis protein TonB
VWDLHAVDSELDGLSSHRQQYRLLHEACGALEELSELGAAGLFWGERAADGADHIRLARGRLDAFEKRLGETEGRRQEILEAIDHEEEIAAFLAGDVLQAQWQEERRKLEWSIEREASPLPVRQSVMPWTRGGEDDERFRKSLAASLLVSLLLGLLIPQIDLPLPEPWEVIEVPDRLVRLIREERPLPPPPPVRAETRPEEVKPEPSEEPQTVPQPEPKQPTKSQGILAFREQFSGLAANAPAARLGAKARITSSGDAGSARPQRSMVTTLAPGSSGGINLAELSRDVVGGGGGGGIEGVQVARATSSIGALNGSGRPLSDGPGAARTDEEIQIVFDRHKAALYRLYNRELRRDPTLQGQMVLRLTIEPDGSVSLCGLQSTDMKAPQLSAQVVERVRTFDFGAKEGIPAITIIYPIDFLPAT